MNKVVYNACYGGFGLSEKAVEYLRLIHEVFVSQDCELPRHDPRLVDVVESLGSAVASMDGAYLRVKVIKGDTYRIEDIDGFESVQTPLELDWVTIQPETYNEEETQND